MRKLSLLFFAFTLLSLSSCSYVHYRAQQDIEHSQSFVFNLEKPLIKIYPFFVYVTEDGKEKSFQQLNENEKLVLNTIFPRLDDFKDKDARFSLKKLVVKRESITSNLTPSIFSIFSILTMGIFPSYITSSFLGHMIVRDNTTGKDRFVHLRPKFIKGMGAIFALINFRYDWKDAAEDPYKNNLSEYYQNYTLMELSR